VNPPKARRAVIVIAHAVTGPQENGFCGEKSSALRKLPEEKTMADFNDDTATEEIEETKLGPSGQPVAVRTVIPLRWLIGIQGDWTPHGLKVKDVTPGGAATKMTSVDGTLTNARMELDDVIVSINDDLIFTDKDWAVALATAPDKTKVKFSVVDSNSGEANDWLLHLQHRPGDGGQLQVQTGVVTSVPIVVATGVPTGQGGAGNLPDAKKPIFPIVKEASGARGLARVTVEDDGVSTLYMKVDTPAAGSTTRYVASVLITGYRDDDTNNVLTDRIESHSLTLGANPLNDETKDASWFISSVKPEDAPKIRHVRILLERDKSVPDLAQQAISLFQTIGQVVDAADTLYKKIKHSELGQDVALAAAGG
jgi:hypothetical protein